VLRAIHGGNAIETKSIPESSLLGMTTIYHLLDEGEAFSERNGGAISRWAANVLRAGSEVVICPSFDSSWGFPGERLFALPNWQRVHSIHPLLYRLPFALQRLAYLQIFKGLLAQLKRGDVLYIHNRPETASVLSTIAEQYGILVVLHMHNSLLLRANQGQIDALGQTPIVFCSSFLRNEALSAFPNHFQKTYVVYNGADGEKFHSEEQRNNSVPTIIYTGRLVPHKGVHVLLGAMGILEKMGVHARCLIVGGASFGKSRETRYTRRLMRLKADNTELLGYRSGDALAEVLRAADVFCSPSIWNDPFPLAPLEAMASGVPVVASNVGGLPEALAHGGGVLVQANDANALAAALERLVRDAAYRHSLGDEARQSFAAHFQWSMVREQYQHVLTGLLA
jgi:spore coat protein SA